MVPCASGSARTSLHAYRPALHSDPSPLRHRRPRDDERGAAVSGARPRAVPSLHRLAGAGSRLRNRHDHQESPRNRRRRAGDRAESLVCRPRAAKRSAIIRGSGCANVISRNAIRRSCAQERFDTIVCVNVLEHIEDDVKALQAFRDIVTPANGHVLIFVPAVQAAYGPLDAELGHHRRYSKRSLGRSLRRRGPQPVGVALHQPDRAARVDVQRARHQVARLTAPGRSRCSKRSSRRGRCRSNA